MDLLTWKNLSAARRTAALRRPAQSVQPAVAATVRAIIAAVRRDGDAALRRFTRKFDGVILRSLRVPEAEFAAAGQSLSRADLAALRSAYRNIRTFHAAQQPRDLRVETQPGIVCAQGRARQRRAVGLAGSSKFGKAEIQTTVAGKVTVSDHIQQAALPAGCNGGQACYRRCQLAVWPHDPQATRALGHQKMPVWQKRQAPGILQARGHNFRANLLRLGARSRQSGYHENDS